MAKAKAKYGSRRKTKHKDGASVGANTRRSHVRDPAQLSFLPPSRKFFGGALLKGKRIPQRPLSFKRPLHLVLKSRLARGRWSFLDSRNKGKIERWLTKFAKKQGLRIYEKALVWDHIHLVVRFPSRAAYCAFIRALTGTLPRSVFGFQDPERSFWDWRPFTRIVEWGRDYARVCEYVIQNTLETLGLVSFRKRGDRYAIWLKDGDSSNSS